MLTTRFKTSLVCYLLELFNGRSPPLPCTVSPYNYIIKMFRHNEQLLFLLLQLLARNTRKERNQYQNHSHEDVKVMENYIVSACPHHVKMFFPLQMRFTGAFKSYIKLAKKQRKYIFFGSYLVQKTVYITLLFNRFLISGCDEILF